MIDIRKFWIPAVYACSIVGIALIHYFEDEGRLAYRIGNSTIGFTLLFASGYWVRTFRSFYWVFGAAIAACSLNAFWDGDPKWPRAVLYFAVVYALILLGQWWLRRKEVGFL